MNASHGPSLDKKVEYRMERLAVSYITLLSARVIVR